MPQEDYIRIKKRRGKRRRRVLGICAVIILFAVVIALSCVLIVKVKDKAIKEPEYKYYSLSEEATARAYVWLSQIDDMPLSYDEVRDIMGDISLKVALEPVKDDENLISFKKNYVQQIAEGAYDNCRNQAKAGLERAYREVLKYRIVDAGYEGDVSDDMLGDLMKEAYGMSVSAYISYSDVKLLPLPEELEQIYSGEVTE